MKSRIADAQISIDWNELDKRLAEVLRSKQREDLRQGIANLRLQCPEHANDSRLLDIEQKLDLIDTHLTNGLDGAARIEELLLAELLQQILKKIITPSLEHSKKMKGTGKKSDPISRAICEALKSNPGIKTYEIWNYISHHYPALKASLETMPQERLQRRVSYYRKKKAD